MTRQDAIYRPPASLSYFSCPPCSVSTKYLLWYPLPGQLVRIPRRLPHQPLVAVQFLASFERIFSHTYPANAFYIPPTYLPKNLQIQSLTKIPATTVLITSPSSRTATPVPTRSYSPTASPSSASTNATNASPSSATKTSPSPAARPRTVCSPRAYRPASRMTVSRP